MFVIGSLGVGREVPRVLVRRVGIASGDLWAQGGQVGGLTMGERASVRGAEELEDARQRVLRRRRQWPALQLFDNGVGLCDGGSLFRSQAATLLQGRFEDAGGRLQRG